MHRPGRGDHPRPLADRHQRLRGQAVLPAARQRRRAARAPGGLARSTSPTRVLLPQPDAGTTPRTRPSWPRSQRDLRQLARDIAADDVGPAELRRRQARRHAPHRTPAPGRSHRMTERPQPDLTHPRDPGLPRRERLVLRPGRSTWWSTSARWRSSPPTRCPASPTTCSRCCPGLREHSCSRGRRGGFVERLHEGTWLGHVAEHCALALQQEVGHDIRRGKTRQVKGAPGRYNVVYGYADEQVGLAAGRLAVRLVNHLVAGRSGVRLGGRARVASSCAPSARRSVRRPRRSSTRRSRATSRGSGSTSTRWSSSARASTRSGSGPR